MIDFHCHVDLYPDPARIAQGCAQRDLYVLSVTTTPDAWYGTAALEQGHMRTALGLHPQLAKKYKSELKLFDDLLPRARYAGEIGLDGSQDCRAYWKDQLEVFHYLLDACARVGGRIMSVHSRHAVDSVLECLEANPNAGIPVFHWFSGTVRDLERAISMGGWFSVNPAMLSSPRGRQLIARMPKQRVLPESDGPFVQRNGAPLLPWHARLVNEGLSRLWQIEQKETDQLLMQNLKRLVGNDF